MRSRQPMTKRDLEGMLINLKNGTTISKYLPVQGRILWFHGEVSRYKIDTEMLHLDWNAEFEGEKWGKDETGKAKKFAIKAKGVAVFKAVVTIYSEAGEVLIQVPGHKSEKAVDFGDFLEKAETGAVGRALALAGYGTKFAIELDEGPRIVDSPVQEQHSANGNSHADGLSDLVARAKKRAMQLNVARNTAEWLGLLEHLKIVEISSLADVGRINGYLTSVERGEAIAAS